MRTISRLKSSVAATLLAGAVITAPSGSVFAENTSKVDDTWLKTKIVTAYTLNRHLSPFEISTKVENGRAMLSGTVESNVEKELASRVAQSVEGVQSVDNRLAVEQNAVRKDNAFYNSVEDATTAASVYMKLLSNKNIDSDDLAVVANNGTITLTGTVATDVQKDLSEMVALDTSGVSRVSNKLAVSNKTPTALDKATAAISDTWITTKVRSNLLVSSGTSGSDLNIDTKNGVVTLSGRVRSPAQKELIERIASDVQGVRNIDNKLRVGA